MCCIYLILAQSLNLLVGYTGLLSMAHAAFYGLGAYISALLMVRAGWNFFATIPVAMVGAMILAVIVALPSLRLRGDYFLLATLAFQSIIFYLLYNWISFTRGPYGIAGIPKPEFLGFKITNVPEYFLMSALITGLIFLIVGTLCSSPFGRVLKSIREDEFVVEALGKNTRVFKIQAFMTAGGLAAVAGSLYAAYVAYIDPTSFTFDESVFILSIIIIGGTGNLKGPVVGTLLMLFLPELLRFLRVSDPVAANVRQIIYGALLVVLMRIRPQGILGDYQFD